MYDLLAKELEKHESRTIYVSNKEDDGISHYYISPEFPMVSGFDCALTRRIRDLEANLGLKYGHPVAYCKLSLRHDGGVIYMGVYFADLGERSVILEPSDFPKLPKYDGHNG